MTRAPDPARRGFLMGMHRSAPPLRPPWALPEALFLDACTGCAACVERCPQQVLSPGGGRYPVFDPRLGECTFCGECADACPTRAIEHQATPWSLAAVAGNACLPRAGIVCSSCRDACPERAVRFPVSRVPVPVVETDACTGCGACVAVCPVGAIELQHRHEEPA